MNLNRWLITIIMILGLLAGCASPGAMSPQQMMAQAQVQAKGGDLNQLNQQILLQGAQAAALKGSQDYRIGPEDLLAIQVYGQEDLERTVRVNGKGEISMPLIGVVKAAGLSPQELERRMIDLYGAKYLRNPQITVFVKEYRHTQVALTGAVKNPGYYEMIGPRTLVEMLAVAGGLDQKAGDLVHIIRPHGVRQNIGKTRAAPAKPFATDAETIVIDMRGLLQGGSGKVNIPIQAGDVINVPFAGNAFVLGAVNRPGNVPVKGELTVTQAIAMAGSTQSLLAKPSAITILRLDEKGQAVSIPVNLNNIIAKAEPDVRLRENDVVFVPESGFKKLLMTIRQLTGGGMSFGYAVAP